MTPRLFVFSGSAVLLGSIPAGQVHSHFAIQLVIALDEGFILTVDEASAPYRGAVIASKVPHLLQPGRGGVLVLLLDPMTRAGVAEAGVAGDAHVRELAASALASVVAYALQFVDRAPTHDEARRLREAALEVLAPGISDAGAGRGDDLDPRVRQVLAHLDAHRAGADVRSLERLAAEVSLSPERLRHLFRAQVGLPVRSYRLWARLGRAVEFLAEGVSLTRAAHSAGFVDSGHLSRAFRQMFGIAPSSLTGFGDVTRP